MWIHRQSNPIDHALQLLSIAFLQQVGDLVEVVFLQHARLWKGELKHGVVGNVVPIDQFIDNVLIYLKWKNLGYYFDGESYFLGQGSHLRNRFEITYGVVAVVRHDFLQRQLAKLLALS